MSGKVEDIVLDGSLSVLITSIQSELGESLPLFLYPLISIKTSIPVLASPPPDCLVVTLSIVTIVRGVEDALVGDSFSVGDVLVDSNSSVLITSIQSES